LNATVNATVNVTENRNKIILKLIRQNNNITTTELSKILNVARRTIARDIDNLKNNGKVKRVGSDKGGYWEIIELNN
jgi:ATP-dependent DNA helicase RecG